MAAASYRTPFLCRKGIAAIIYQQRLCCFNSPSPTLGITHEKKKRPDWALFSTLSYPERIRHRDMAVNPVRIRHILGLLGKSAALLSHIAGVHCMHNKRSRRASICSNAFDLSSPRGFLQQDRQVPAESFSRCIRADLKQYL
ncbi:MAG: hypothetical protein UY63_C0017G0018 [Parcubacteria group bacterium GW2011_GWA2_51_10]|nr:MAG: hypothetical protein UY63_C0017G0018 [Parcubacteria group bacterium GW2011_GWA2_51_10]